MTTKTVWKYQLEITDDWQELSIPKTGHVVLVAMQQGQLCLWVEVDPAASLAARWFAVHGTGHVISAAGLHVGSVVTRGGALVWHVYEVNRA